MSAAGDRIGVKRLGNIVNRHAGMLNHQQQFIARETAKQIMQAEKDLITHFIDESKLYNQAVLFGGYPGFFAFGGFMKDKMDEYLFVASGFLMAVSVATIFLYCLA